MRVTIPSAPEQPQLSALRWEVSSSPAKPSSEAKLRSTWPSPCMLRAVRPLAFAGCLASVLAESWHNGSEKRNGMNGCNSKCLRVVLRTLCNTAFARGVSTTWTLAQEAIKTSCQCRVGGHDRPGLFYWTIMPVTKTEPAAIKTRVVRGATPEPPL